MRSSRLKVVTAFPADVAATSPVCCRFGCRAEPNELRSCALGLAWYRLQRLIDQARLAALTRWLLHRKGPPLAGWPAEHQPVLARNLPGHLPWDRCPAAWRSIPSGRGPRRHPGRMFDYPDGLGAVPLWGQLRWKARALARPRHRPGAAPPERGAWTPCAALVEAEYRPQIEHALHGACPRPQRREASPPRRNAAEGGENFARRALTQ